MESTNERFVAFVDGLTPEAISGWARWESSSDPVVVELLVNGVEVGRFSANQHRKDLTAQRPDGNFAFSHYLGSAHDLLDCVGQNAVVEVREVNTGETLPGGHATWNGRAPEGLPGVVTPDGDRLRIIKSTWSRPLSDYSQQTRQSIASAASELMTQASTAGFTLILGYGSLLGAVRAGEMIGHDDDVDLIYVSAAPDMLAASEDLIAFRDWMRSQGHWAQDVTNGQLQIMPIGASGIGIDVFAAWFEDSQLSLCFTVCGGPHENEVLPPGEVTFEGVKLPAPRRPEVVLEAIYGPAWATPDPGFVWRRSSEVEHYFRSMHNYSRGATVKYWSDFYGGAVESIRTEASDFATFVDGQVNSHAAIVDIGCGSGRDSMYFALRNHRVLGLDGSREAVTWCREKAKSLDISGVEMDFLTTDLSIAPEVATAIRRVREFRGGSRLVLYARFLLHAIDEPSELLLLQLASDTLLESGEFWLEFRTLTDGGKPTVHGDHFRRYIDTNRFVQRARDNFGLACTYHVEGRGFAVYGSEDPHIARVRLTLNPSD